MYYIIYYSDQQKYNQEFTNFILNVFVGVSKNLCKEVQFNTVVWSLFTTVELIHYSRSTKGP